MDFNLPLALALGAGLGLVFSMLGAGGGVLAVPILLFAFHLPLAEATGTSLAIACSTALVSGFFHWRNGNVDFKVAGSFAATALVLAPVGGLLHPHVPQRITLLLFCAVLLVVAVRMWRTPSKESTGHFSVPLALAFGAGVGLLTGLLGVGGGFVVVPVLTTLLGVPVRKAIGSSVVVVFASSLSGSITYAASGSVDWSLLFAVGSGAMVGAVIGVPLSKKLPELILRRGFAVVAVGVAVRMIVEAVQL